MALGASRPRVFRQLVIENLILSFLAGMVGLLMAVSLVPALVAYAPTDVPRLGEVRVDGEVLAYAFVLSIVAGIAFGLLPALQLSGHPGASGTLNSGRTTSTSAPSERMRSILVCVEVALTLVLLIGVSLMTASLVKLNQERPGFNPERLLTLVVAPPENRYRGRQKQEFFDRLIVEIARIPEVQSVAATSTLPMSPETPDYDMPYTMEGRPPVPVGSEPQADFRIVSPGYFRTMGIPVLEGREFEERDREGRPLVMIINDVMARQVFPNESAIGKRIRMYDGRTWEVAGVVGGVKHHGLGAELRPEFYVPFLQLNHFDNLTVVLRTVNDPIRIVNAVKSAVYGLDPNQPVTLVRGMEEILNRSIAQPRFRTYLVGGFSVLGALLAVLGIYGLMSYFVNRRIQEIGLRIALGARHGDVVRIVILRGMLPTVAGIGLGVALSLALARFLSGLLYGISSQDPLTFVSIPILFVLVAALACYLPAQRAARIEPVVALRQE
jgi:putative ABC transport system permease protein